MATRAASTAPIQRVLRESGVQDPLPRANRNLNTVKTTLNPGYSGARKHCPFGQVLATCFTYARIARKRRSMKNPTSSVECGTSWLEKADVERRASFDRRGTYAADWAHRTCVRPAPRER
jgi:hypothetical protein